MVKIACIGNITYDILAYTKDFPKENSRWDYDKIITSTGGPASNAAFLLDKYNQNVDLYGIIGTDKFSKLAYKELKKSNINLENLIIKKNMSIPLSYIIVSENNQTRTINSYRDKIDNKDITFKNYKNNYDLILTDGKYPKATLELIKQNPGALTIIDAGRCSKDIINLCKYIDCIICSEDFANDFAKAYNINHKLNTQYYSETKSIMNLLMKEFNTELIAATMGKDGYVYIKDGCIVLYGSAKKLGKVVDTTAAGDIFHGAFVYALAKEKSFEDALEFANNVSSLSVTKYGGKTSIPEFEEIKEIEKKKNLIYKL